jgi:hypothetical protein
VNYRAAVVGSGAQVVYGEMHSSQGNKVWWVASDRGLEFNRILDL